MTRADDDAVPFGRRVRELAALHPEAPAVVAVDAEGREDVLSWEALEQASNRAARTLQAEGIGEGQLVGVALPNGRDHVITVFGALKVGATVVPLPPDLPPRDRRRVLATADPAVVVATWGAGDVPVLHPERLQDPAVSPARLPDRVADPAFAMLTGGATGPPKLVVLPGPGERVPGHAFEELGPAVGLRPGMVHLVVGPLHHGNPFGMTYQGLFDDHTIVLAERFDAAQTVRLIERHGVQYLTLAPSMMRAILRLPTLSRQSLTSVERLFHSFAPCPPAVKRGWIDLIGADRVYEGFGSTEGVGISLCSGEEWLQRPGTVGRGFLTEIRILGPEGERLGPGEIGEVFMRMEGVLQPPFVYVGQPTRATPDGFASVGDMGWLDEDGWLFPADRVGDLITARGHLVIPSRVEAAILEHPDVEDAAVFAVPDEQDGTRVHAIVQPAAGSGLTAETLLAHCRERLAAHEVPRSMELVEAVPRETMGKLQRSRLAEDRADEVPLRADSMA